jgi:hypothetical protein
MRVVLLSFPNPFNRLCHLIKVILLMDLSESDSITINYISNYKKDYLSKKKKTIMKKIVFFILLVLKLINDLASFIKENSKILNFAIYNYICILNRKHPLPPPKKKK